MIRSARFLAVLAGVFLGALDQTVVATLLPTIVTDLEIPFTRLHEAAWIITGYLLGYTVAMPLVGQVADTRGRARVFVGCMLLFVAASVACGAAPTLGWLIAARALQAIGGGAVLPVALALSTDAASPARRLVLLGLVGAVAEAGGVLGPLYGAALVQWLPWRWVFYLNVPIGLLIGAIVLGGARHELRPGGRVDLAGAGLLGLALAALTVGLSQEGALTTEAAVTAALIALAVAFLAVFIVVERRAREPLIDLALFGRRGFTAANLTNLFVGAGLIVAMVNVPLWSATVLQRSATEGGLLLLRFTLFVPVGAFAGGWLTRAVGARATATVGLLAAAASFALLARWPASVDDLTMTRDLAPGGLGYGLLLAPVTATAIAWAGEARAAVAASLVTLMRLVGMMVGLSALTSFGLGRFNALVRDLPLPLAAQGESAAVVAERQSAYAQRVLDATVTVYHEIFLVAALVCVVAIIPALLMRRPMGPDL